MQVAPSLIDWTNPVSDWANDLGLVDGWIVAPGKQGWGTSTLRSLRQRYNGTLENMDPATAWVTDSPVGHWGSLDFDGIDDYLDMGNSHALVSSQPALSLDCLFAGPEPQSIMRFQTSARDYFVPIWRDPRGGGDGYQAISSAHGGTSGGLEWPSTIHDGDWHHLAMTFDISVPNGWRIFVDGVLVDSTDVSSYGSAITSISTTQPVRFNCYTPSAEFTRGKIARQAIWNTALTDAQVSAIYEDLLRGYPRLLRRVPTTSRFVFSSGGGGGPTYSPIHHLYKPIIGAIT